MNCPRCNHPADSHNEAGCFHDSGFPCVCMMSYEEILFPEQYAKTPADPTTAMLRAHNRELKSRNAELILQIEGYEDAMRELDTWAKAYPLDIFPEPDFKRANEILHAHGMTVDAISASAMRHLLVRVQEIVKKVVPDD